MCKYIQWSGMITPEDKEFLEQLAQENDRSASAELRRILRRERERLQTREKPAQ